MEGLEVFLHVGRWVAGLCIKKLRMLEPIVHDIGYVGLFILLLLLLNEVQKVFE